MDFYIVKYKVNSLSAFLWPMCWHSGSFLLAIHILPWLSSQFTGYFSFVLVPHKLSDFLKLNLPGFIPSSPWSWFPPPLMLSSSLMGWNAVGMLTSPQFLFLPFLYLFGELWCLLSNCQCHIFQTLKQPPTLLFHNTIPLMPDKICFSYSSPFKSTTIPFIKLLSPANELPVLHLLLLLHSTFNLLIRFKIYPNSFAFHPISTVG